MKKFGLIGYPLSHSFSKKYFTDKFEKEAITDCSYDLFPLENIDDVRLLFEVEKSLCGLNVTIPYKESVIQYLDGLDAAAKKIGAVNCIKISEIEKTGFNTDHMGFRDSIVPLLQTHHTKALVLGTGGASKAVVFSLQELGIETKYVSRRSSADTLLYTELNKSIMDACPLIINTSPLGMYPDLQSAPDIPYQFLTKDHLCYDLIYNPAETLFLQRCKEAGSATKNGQEMLELQAEYAWKIWNNE